MAERQMGGSENEAAGQADRHPASTDSDLLALPAGYSMHEYRIDRVLGSGGFGITYLAHDTHLDCPVAIKEYLPRDTAGRSSDLSVRPHSTAGASAFAWGLDRFLHECRALASFHHPGIVRVLRYYAANATAYMVMEYESGEPLDRWLHGREPIDGATLQRIVRPLLDGLETIHNAGFLHRDIKPRNIYMRADGSPVLLDFGSARRLGAPGQEQLLTAVVTPGFAPAEQYQPDGRQGPWSDLYSLAGVLYWLVTGHLPTESLARLREDPMPAAAAIGRTDLYGKAMLRAIDWALTPDENLRPRRVADFRRACLPPAGDSAEAGDSPAALAVLPAPGSSFSEGCSFIGAVLFSDVVAASATADGTAEAAHKERRQLLATLVGQAVTGVPAKSRLAANTREGCAVCYVGDPEDALRTASLLGAAASERGLGLHIGINLGPVRVQPDPGGRSRLLGDGVATAFRVMRLAEPGEVLVSAAYVDLIAQLRRSAVASFKALGERRDPQDRVHDLYLYVGSATAQASHPITANAAAAGAVALTSAVIDDAEKLLTRYIGPMARILVRRTLPRVGGRDELHRLLAEMIPDTAARSAFLAAATHSLQQSSASQPPDSARRSGTASPPVAATAPLAAVAATGGLAEADCERVGRILARHIGPLARILLRREAVRATDVDSLCRALASQIDSPEQRDHFLREAGVGKGQG